MPSQPPIPHLLAPYLTHSTHSAQSLTIITSVLAATPNWLVLRYLHSVLSATTENHDSHQEGGSGRKKRRKRAKRVVLVSFLREWLFWRGEGKRLGLDLQRFVDGDRLRFVDGLSGLFDVSRQTPQPPQQVQQQAQQGSIRSGLAMGSARSTPMRPPASPRAPPSPSTASAATPSPTKTPIPQHKQLHISGQGISALNQLENDILSVIQSFPNPHGTNETSEDAEDGDGDDILLILDQPDLILATTPGIDANDLSERVVGLQQHVLSTIITTSADSPLIHKANPYTLTLTENASAAATPLEKNHASFVVGLAHRADMVLQLRTLDTGAAKDVSGVLRMSRGGGYDETEGEGDGEIAEKEVLYFVQRDGGVRVFGRGEV